MKTTLLIATMALGLLTPALAQYQTAGNDGIAASPKFRQVLDARKTSVTPAAPVVTAQAAAPVGFGSPRYLESWGKAKTPATIPVATKDYALSANCTGHKTLASPKARDILPKAAGGCCGMSACMTACAR